MSIDTKEARRVTLQEELDAEKTAKERNVMGQFATPTALARDIISYGRSLLADGEPITFMDPGLGTGSFYSALLATTPRREIERSIGFEIDPHYGAPAAALWCGDGLNVRLEDFTSAQPAAAVNLLISNPPYVRHHHLTADQKARLKLATEAACGVAMSGLSGLYCYFMGLAHPWMAPGAVAGWLIPSEFMDVNYGRQVKRYLLDKVTLLRIHRFDPADVQFADALVSSAIVWIRNEAPEEGHKVEFTFGGTLSAPEISRSVLAAELRSEPKWTRYPAATSASQRGGVTLGDLFEIKRGIATGDNRFFIMDRTEIEERGLPLECFRPVLPSSRHIKTDHITADADGVPEIDRPLFLLDTKLSLEEIEDRFPKLADYLETGRQGEKAVADRYLCRSRRPWYAQEQRPAAPFICTYMGRPKDGAKPFRFILNESDATACNVYLMMYPKPPLAKAFEANPQAKRVVWEFLNNIPAETLLGSGRVYGGGLHKMEPKELRSVNVDRLVSNLGRELRMGSQSELFEQAA